MKQAIIVDVYSRGTYHEVINLVYLMSVARHYDSVTYLAAASACDNLRVQLASLGVDTSHISFVEKHFSSDQIKSLGSNKLAERLKYSWLKYWYYMQAPAGADVFYNNNLFLAIPLIQYLSLGKKQRVFSLLHGEMEVIDPATAMTKEKSMSAHFFGWVFRNQKLSARFKFIILSADMHQYFCSKIAEKNRERIAWMDHGYVRPANPFVGELTFMAADYKGLKVGLPSILNVAHGIDIFRKLLSAIPSSSDVMFYAVSRVEGEICHEKFVQLSPEDDYLPSMQYNACVQAMDVLLLPYQAGSGRLTASGAALEAIWCRKPIIAMRTYYLDYLFCRFGSMGILCDDETQLADAVAQWGSQGAEMLARYQENLDIARAALSPENVSRQFAEIIS